jgi:hypothetical protein
MTTHLKVLNFIYAIRDSHPHMEYVYTHGSCLNFFCILKQVFPQAKPWFNADHIITEIDEKFYDITGRVSNEGYAPYTSYYSKKGTSRSFTQMYDAIPDINMKTINDVRLNNDYKDGCYSNEIVVDNVTLIKECSEDIQELEYLMLYKIQNYINALEWVKQTIQGSVDRCNDTDKGHDVTVANTLELELGIGPDIKKWEDRAQLLINGNPLVEVLVEDDNEDAIELIMEHARDIHYKLGKLLYAEDEG